LALAANFCKLIVGTSLDISEAKNLKMIPYPLGEDRPSILALSDLFLNHLFSIVFKLCFLVNGVSSIPNGTSELHFFLSYVIILSKKVMIDDRQTFFLLRRA